MVGRKRDFIKVGANRVSAKEVEEIIAENPDVHEVAVIGARDEMLGEKICAFIVLNEGASIESTLLRRELRGKLPTYKIPSDFVFVPDLPKNESGKIMKRELETRLESKAESSTAPDLPG